MSNKTARQKGVLPKLRFPAFQGHEKWSCPSLSDISTPITRKVGDLSLETASITAGFGFVSQSKKFGRDISGKQYKNYIVLNEGEFSYNKGNSKKFPQGCIYKLTGFKKVAVPNSFISFRIKKNYVADFYRGYFDNNFHGWQIIQFITSGARSDGLLNINSDDFYSIKLPTPSEKEQQKIADCLSSIDELIAAEGQRLEALREHKKGLMQQLFPAAGETLPKLRFPAFRDAPGWEVKKFEEIYSFKRTNSYSREMLNLEKGTIKNIHYGDIHKKYPSHFNIEKEHVPYVIESSLIKKITQDEYCREGDLIFADASEDIEDVGKCIEVILLNNEKIISGLHTILARQKTERLVIGFSGYLFHSYVIRDQIRKESQGAKVLGISRGRLAGIDVCFPKGKKEQQKIADCLSSIDELIAAEGQRLEALREHKKGLMQQLFPAAGEVAG